MRTRRKKRQQVPCEPVPPTNVRIVLANGDVVPVECEYVGLQPNGQHLWNAVIPYIWVGNMAAEAFDVACDMVPAKTDIGLRVAGEWVHP